MVSRTDDPERRARGSADLILALALLAGLVRFLKLGEFGLWYDEVLTWGDAHRIGAGDGEVAPRNVAGYAIVRATVAALGHGPTEGALRFAPALAGWLAIPLTAFAFRPIAGALRANLAALVVALSAFQVQWSQTARFYTFAEVSVLAGTGLLLRGVYGGERGARAWQIALAMALGLASLLFHISGLIVCAATVVALGPELLRRLGVFATGAGPGVPRSADPGRAVPPHGEPPHGEASGAVLQRRPGPRRAVLQDSLLWRRLLGRQRATLALVGLGVAAAVAFVFAWPLWVEYERHKSAPSALGGVRHFALSLASSVTPGLSVAGLAALVAGRFRSDSGLRLTFAVNLFGIAALALFASRVTVSAYYAFALFPWLALLAAWPVGSPGLAPRVRAAWGLVVALPLLAPLTLYFLVENGQRPRWREAAAFVDARRSSTDAIAAIPASVLEFYLSGGRETETRKAHAVENIDSFDPLAAIELAHSGRTVWYVVRRDYLQRFRPDDRALLEGFFAGECRRVAIFPVLVSGRDLAIEVWRYGD